jgi:hypothetical protein
MFWGIIKEGFSIVFGSLVQSILDAVKGLLFKSPEAKIQELEDINKDQAQTIQEIRNAEIIKQNVNSLSHDELAEWVRKEQSHHS